MSLGAKPSYVLRLSRLFPFDLGELCFYVVQVALSESISWWAPVMVNVRSAGYPAMYESLPGDIEAIDITMIEDREQRVLLTGLNGSWSASGLITELVERFGPVLRKRIASAGGRSAWPHPTERPCIGSLLCGRLVRPHPERSAS